MRVPPAGRRSKGGSRRPTILIVEDNAVTRKMLRVTFETAGYAVVESGDGRGAVGAMRRHLPDLVIQDLLLPDVDGFALVAQLRAMPGAADVPILAFSGYSPKLEKSLQAGFTDYIFKPAEPSRLLATVETYLPTPRAEPAEHRGRIVLVDDDPVGLKLTRLYLEREGFSVVTASDGDEALAKARAAPPAAIVSDVLMPRMDGFRLCAAIRADPALKDVPVVLQSSLFVESADAELARAAGASAFVSRTSDCATLVEALQASLAAEVPRGGVDPSALAETYLPRIVYQLERQAGVNAALTRRVAVQQAELSIIGGIAEMLQTAVPLDDILTGLLYRCLDAAGVSRGAIYLVASHGRLAPATSLGFSDTRSLADFFGHTELLEEVLREGRSYETPSAGGADAERRDLLERAAVGSLLIAPMIVADERIGLLVIGSGAQDLTENWQPFARAIAAQIGHAVAVVTKAREKDALMRALRDSEERYRLVVENIHDAVFLVDLEGRFLFGNGRIQQLTGYRVDDLVGRSIFEVLAPDAVPAAEARREAVRAGHDGPFFYETEFVRKDGTKVWVVVNSTSVVEDGRIVARLGAVRDITQRREAERRRAAEYAVSGVLAEARTIAAAAAPVLRAIGEAFDWEVGALWMAGADTDVLRCVELWHAEGTAIPEFERATRELTFARGVGLPGRVWASGAPVWIADVANEPNVPRGAVAARNNLHAFFGFPVALGHDVMGVVEFFSHEIRSPDRVVLDWAVSIGRQIAQFSERKHAESKLRDTNAELEALLHSSPATVVAADLRGRVTRWNKTAERLLGWTEAELIGRPLPHVPENEAEETRASLELWTQGAVTTDVEVVRQRKDGSSIPMSRSGAPLRDAEGRIIGTITNLVDISDRKRAEAALRESEERFRATFEQAAVGIGHTTTEGRWLRVNQRLCDIVGYTREELLTRTFQQITHPDDLNLDLVQMRQLLAGEIETLSRERRYLHKDGSVVWIDLTVSLVCEPSGEPKYFIAVVQDITARKQLEQELHHSQRMEGVGQLAGGIAHDFNNLLTVISGRSQLGLERLSPADPLRRDLELIHKTSDRAAALTRQLLAFSRKQVLQPKVVVLNELVAGSTDLLKRLIGENIELTFVPGADLGRTRVDPGQIEQVIVNVVVNARDAMPEGGQLTLGTANVEFDETYAARHVGVVAGRYVMLAVTDTGAGMSREVQTRIFEPFFTTKGPGKGTGLGLATVYGIVKQSGGHIRVSSEPGAGTTFKVYLPRTDAAAEAAAPGAREALPRGTETILLVEDEAEVRSLAMEVLERLGYTVLEASEPTDAMLIAQRHVGIIDLLLTDVVMPRMSGRALAEAIAAERPETRILFMSGYTDDAIIRHRVLEPGTHFLEKPFTPPGLAAKVREVLDERG